MPKKKHKETPEEQAARFTAAVQRLIDAGELDPAEADAMFERAMSGVVKLQAEWFAAGDLWRGRNSIVPCSPDIPASQLRVQTTV